MPPRPRHEAQRTCVGCRQESGKHALIRVVRLVGGGAQADPRGTAPGRGAYVHRDVACLDAARKKRTLEKALRTPIPPELWTALEREASQGSAVQPPG